MRALSVQVRPRRRLIGKDEAAEGSAPKPRRRDPAPSRLRYRLDRLARRGSVKFALKNLGGPAVAIAIGIALWSSEAVHTAAGDVYVMARDAVMTRPELAVTSARITGGSPELRGKVARQIDLQTPTPSLSLDLKALQAEVETVPGVASASVSIVGEGVLRIVITQRAAVALWRWGGLLHLVDRDGVVISPVARRHDRRELPLVVGEGADQAIPEALRLWQRTEPLHDRLRALVRVGDRRWTLALTGGQSVFLPADDPLGAVGRLLTLDQAEDLFERELSVIDLRDPERPTLRLTPQAVRELERLKALVDGEDA